MTGKGLFDKFLSALSQDALCEETDSVLVGLSGGADSACLLLLFAEKRNAKDFPLHAVYVDHGLRPSEVPSEIAFCERLCGRLNVHFMVKRIAPKLLQREKGMNLHEAARELRYQAFEQATQECNADRIALAHHADDQAETMLMRLVRGTGPSGLAGIPSMRGKIIRPLLSATRREIEDYLSARGETWVLDSSNASDDYTRNRLRRVVMPELRKLNPALAETLWRSSRIFSDEERYFGIAVTKALMRMISRKGPQRIELFLTPMETLDPVILRRVLRRAMDDVETLRGIGSVHIEDMMRLIRGGKAGDRLALPHGIRVIRDYSLLIVTSELPLRISSYELSVPGQVVVEGTGVVVQAALAESEAGGMNRHEVVLDAGAMSFPLRVRPRNQGDFFYPLGFGSRKKLQDYFVDEKVPRDERDSVALVVSGADIVWVAGYRADHRFRVSQDTKKFVRLAIVKGKF